MRKPGLAAAMAVLAASVSPVCAQTNGGTGAPDIDITGPAIRVTDLERSLKFYVGALGLQVLQRLNEGNGLAVILAPQGRSMPPIIDLLQTDHDPAKSAPVVLGNGFSRIILSVTDSRAVYAKLKAAGYAPGGNGGGGIFFVKDPDGYALEVTQRRSASTTSR